MKQFLHLIGGSLSIVLYFNSTPAEYHLLPCSVDLCRDTRGASVDEGQVALLQMLLWIAMEQD